MADNITLNIVNPKIIVVGDNFCWGKGDTVEEARRNADNPRKYLVYVVHPDSTVNGMGGIEYPAGSKPWLIERHGMPQPETDCTHQGAVIRKEICSRCGQKVRKTKAGTKAGKEVQTQG